MTKQEFVALLCEILILISWIIIPNSLVNLLTMILIGGVGWVVGH